MNIYFSGIGGVALGPLAEIAQDAGHHVQGSDPQQSLMTKQLQKRGIDIAADQHGGFLQTCHQAAPIDWLVYTSALPPDHPELAMAKMLGIKATKRDEFLALFLRQTGLKLIAIAGTHGKTGTTAMLAWVFKQLGIPISYSIGTTIHFGANGQYDPASQYFIYECDEYDRNFLKFHPHLAIITSLDYDHPDIYATPGEYLAAFKQFINQSAASIMWHRDGALLDAHNSWELRDDEVMPLALPGEFLRRNATLLVKAAERLGISGDVRGAIESFPGADRRFEKLLPNLYSDYGHHPSEIATFLQAARELNDHVVLVYQPHQNTRQHAVRAEYTDCFELAETVYWLPTYLSREDPSLPILTPDDLAENVTNIDSIYTAEMDDELWETIQRARNDGKLVVCMGAGSIDEWVRSRANTVHTVNVLVINQEGNFVFRRQQGAPGIVAPFGDAVKSDDASLLAAAERVVREATNIPVRPGDIAFFKMYFHDANPESEKNYASYFILANVDTTDLKLAGGVDVTIANPANLGDYPLSIFTRTVIVEYTRPAHLQY